MGIGDWAQYPIPKTQKEINILNIDLYNKTLKNNFIKLHLI